MNVQLELDLFPAEPVQQTAGKIVAFPSSRTMIASNIAREYVARGDDPIARTEWWRSLYEPLIKRRLAAGLSSAEARRDTMDLCQAIKAEVARLRPAMIIPFQPISEPNHPAARPQAVAA